ncbi:hypothetical protein BCR34DRAFT_105198 [Clohesyomyces aquaticus]|uniref:Uncharacterized protein n=1 Tax=Clohesyomyces aquaticus TaxID=1231657 RepID=A0A1Y2A1P3_9PLEO|nr:hypothetical protein BCR34DRAFT_105198 [Clohesyomyces aquaticus]
MLLVSSPTAYIPASYMQAALHPPRRLPALGGGLPSLPRIMGLSGNRTEYIDFPLRSKSLFHPIGSSCSYEDLCSMWQLWNGACLHRYGQCPVLLSEKQLRGHKLLLAYATLPLFTPRLTLVPISSGLGGKQVSQQDVKLIRLASPSSHLT